MKRFISLTLMVAIFFASSSFSFAYEKPSEHKAINIEKQIALAKEKEYTELYKQLEEQNALNLIDQFIEALDPIIENEIMLENDCAVTPYSTTKTYTASKGCVLGYKNSIGGYVLSTYVLPEIGNKYIISKKTFTIATIANMYLGLIPSWGTAFSALFSLKLLALSSQSDSVKEAGGYAQIMNIRDASGIENATYIRGWNTYPKVKLSTSGLSDIHYKAY